MTPPHDPISRLLSLATEQYGHVTRRQAIEHGLSVRALRRLVGDGVLEPVTRLVLRVAGTPRSPEAAAMAALLDLGPASALTRPTAMAVWEHPSAALDPPHVVVPRHRRSGLVEPAHLHTATWLTDDHVAQVGPLRVTTPTVTVVDMADRLSVDVLERHVDWFWLRGMLLPSRLRHAADTIGRHRPGRRKLHAILDERADEDAAPGSNTESRFHQILRDDGQQPMRRQVWMGDDRPIGRVDFVDDEAGVIVEVQSSLFHGSLSDRRRDAERHARLRAAGWTVIEVWEDDVWRDARRVAAVVGRARDEGRRARRRAS